MINNDEIKILYVEDQPETSMLVARMLHRKYKNLFLAKDGKEGYDMFLKNKPTIVISDIRMPIMDGLEMSRLIKKYDNKTQIILTTAHSDIEFFLKSIDIGIDKYIMKPVDGTVLFDTIEKCVREKSLELELVEKNAIINNTHNQLKAILECSSDSYFFVDKDFKIILFNKYAKERIKVNFNRELSVGDQLLDFFDDAHKETVKLILDNCLKGKVFKEERLSHLNNGLTVWIEYELLPVFDKDVFLGVSVKVKNINEKKIIETAILSLVKSTSSYRDVFFNSLVLEIARILQVKNVFIARFHDQTQVLRTLAICDHEAILPNYECKYSCVHFENMKNGDISFCTNQDLNENKENCFIKKLDVQNYFAYPLLSHNDKPIGVIGITDNKPLSNNKLANDLVAIFANRIAAEIEREDYENDLKSSNKSLIEAQRLSKIGTWTDNFQTKKASFSESFFDLIGLEDKALCETFSMRDFFKLTNEEDTIFVKDSISKTLSEKLETFTLEYRIKTFDNRSINVISRVNMTYDNNREPLFLLGTLQDITEQKHAEELSRKVEVAEHSAKLKQQFLANMSHEIRTPMTGIIGMTEFLLKTELNEKQREYAHIIKTSSESLMEIINDILDLSKIEAGKLKLSTEEFALNHFCYRIYLFFEILVKNKGLKFRTSVAPDVPPVISADRSRLQQIITNLVSNAIKFTENGEVVLEIKIKEKHTDSYTLLFEIHDTGIGIDEDDKDKLFNKFVQIESANNRQYAGTGLGLTISKELVEMMGGEIGFRSKKGKGSTFWFTFQTKSSEMSIKTDDVKIDTNEIPNLNLRVLVAEDNFVVQTVVRVMLENAGCMVVTANNGALVLEAFQEGLFDVILMDIQMPIMDGIEATKELRKKFKLLPPIIGLSANALEGDSDRFIQAGLDDYLSKPVPFENLIAKLKKWTGFKNDTDRNTKLITDAIDSVQTFELLDKEALATVKSHMSDDEEMYREMLNAFYNDVVELSENISMSFKIRDMNKLQRSIHSIKGLSGTMGAKQTYYLSSEIDSLLKKEEFESAISLIPALQENITLLLKHLYTQYL